MDNITKYTTDKIKVFMIGKERNNTENIIDIMKKEGYEVIFLNDELDVLTTKQRKTIHFVKKNKIESIKKEKEKQEKINGLNRI